MQIRDAAGRVLLSDVRVADSFFSRFKGLMGRESIPGDGLYITPCTSIHCFFMKIPIDAVFIDSKGLIMGIEAGLPPWRISSFYPTASGVLELSAGRAVELKLSIGQTLLLS